jgi:hypothetical protein
VQQADTLELLAELGVAFAGFTGLVGAFRVNPDHGSTFRRELRLLIEFSLYLMISAAVPLFLWNVGLPEATAWRLASLVGAAFLVLYWTRRFRTHLAKTAEDGTLRILIGSLVVEVAFAAMLLLNGVGALPWEPHVIYLANLFYQLVATSLSFMRFASPLWRESDA